MAPRIEPGRLRARVIDALADLPPEQHLAVLHAVDHGDMEIDLIDPATVLVTIQRELSIEIPLRECTVDDG